MGPGAGQPQLWRHDGNCKYPCHWRLAGNPSGNRLVSGAIVTVKPTDADTVIVEPYYANDSTNPNTAAGFKPNARWNGVAAYLIHDFTPHWSLRGRCEIFEDNGGTRTCGGTWNLAGGTNTCFGATSVTAAPPVSQTLWEVTPTLQYRPVAPLILRVEYRYDKSEKDVFLFGDRATNHQQTMSFQVVYLF